MKRGISIIILLFALTAATSRAQSYRTAIGLRLGGITSGITLKHFIGGNDALEGIVSFGRHAVVITGLYENHHAFPTAEGLSWFWGGGLHFGFFGGDYHYDYFYYKYHKGKNVIVERVDDFDTETFAGADFILGMDYKFRNVPINLSLDVKPFVDFTPGVYGYWEGALSFRFTF